MTFLAEHADRTVRLLLVAVPTSAGATYLAAMVRRTWRRRGVQGRLMPVRRRADHAVTTSRHRLGIRIDSAVRLLGRGPRRLARCPATPATDRRLGWAFATGLVGALVAGPVVAFAVAGVVAALPALRERRDRVRRSRAVADDMPEVIDLVAVAVGAGLDIGSALAVVADHHVHGPVADALAGVSRRMARGDRLIDSLVEVEALGDPARAFHAALVGSLRHGVPLAPALDRAAAEARDTRRRRREEAARTLPVKLLFPLVFCTLPALVLLTVVPLLVRSFPSLSP